MVVVYTKPSGAPEKLGLCKDVKWTRTVLDRFGPLSQSTSSSICQVVCADIDGDGNDEFLVAMAGTDPLDFEKTGVWCYARMLQLFVL